MKEIVYFVLIISGVLLFSCDPKLFETEEDPPAPEVSQIYSSLSNSNILAGDSAEFWVEASNPGEGGLIYNWDISSGEFLSTPDEDSIKWRAPFTGGNVTIEVSVSNTDKGTSRSRLIEVVSLDIPVVNILYPREDSYLVQYETINIEMEAFHDNGISHVEIFVNDSSLGIIDGNATNRYTAPWLNEAPAGRAEIKVTAVSRRAGTIGSDNVSVNIEGVIPRKK